LLSAVAVAQGLGSGVGPIPFAGSYVMAPIALNLAGSAEQKQKYLPNIVSNETKFGVGLSEYVAAREDAGIDLIKGKANGKALFVIDGEEADYFILANKGGVIFLVDAKDSGLEINKLTSVDKTRSYLELNLKDVAAEILPESENNPELAKKVVDAGRIIFAADSLGASENMIEQAVSYAKERKQFNRVIGSFQAVKHMCAEMAADLEPCYAMLWQAAHSFDNSPEEARLQACQAKSHISEVAKMISKKATEVHGGMGFTDLLGLHYWFKRIGLNRQLLGGPELVREEAAEIQGFNQ
jgi:alkylation response protein AidB-like acyl-CoA dehydrogenase